MEKLSVLLCSLCALCLVASMVDGATAPSPSMDCTNSLLDLANCVTFVQNGSTLTKPDDGCCSGLKTVMKDHAACLCDVFKNSNNYGISLNRTKALSLPSVCGIHHASFSQCAAIGVPVGAPSHGVPIGAPSHGVPIGAPSHGVPVGAPSHGVPVGAPSHGAPVTAPSHGVPVTAPSHSPSLAPATSPKSSHHKAPAPAPMLLATPPSVSATPPVVAPAPPVVATPPAVATTPTPVMPRSSGVIAEIPTPAPAESGNREMSSGFPVLSIVFASLAVAMGSFF